MIRIGLDMSRLAKLGCLKTSSWGRFAQRAVSIRRPTRLRVERRRMCIPSATLINGRSGERLRSRCVARTRQLSRRSQYSQNSSAFIDLLTKKIGSEKTSPLRGEDRGRADSCSYFAILGRQLVAAAEPLLGCRLPAELAALFQPALSGREDRDRDPFKPVAVRQIATKAARMRDAISFRKRYILSSRYVTSSSRR